LLSVKHVCYSVGMTETKNYTRATVVATSVLAFGVAASLAGNVQAIHLDNARPGIGAILSAVVWPLILFGVVEMLLHTPWIDDWRDNLTKLATVLAVGGVAAWISYWHLANVLSHFGYDVASRYAGPLAVDMGMILAARALYRVGLAKRGQVDTGKAGTVSTLVAKDMVAGLTSVAMDSKDIPRATAEDVAISEAAFRGDFGPVSTPGHDVHLSTALTDRLVDDDATRLGDEAESYLAGLQKRVPTEHTPPVPVTPGPSGARRPSPRPRTEIDAEEAYTLALTGKAHGAYSRGEIRELLAGWYGVSTRTIRRQPWWTAAMGKESSEGAGAS
jgi:hypothetical protein